MAQLPLFAAYGIELEYMIVDRNSMAPLFICDQVLASLAGHKTMAIEMGKVAWSNELALHIIELKCNGPQADLMEVQREMHLAIGAMNQHLATYNARLLPTAMHPLFDPNDGSLRLWSDEDAEIYASYDRIFGCQGHGWSNLQSIHINLPFNGDQEFFALHAAIRLLLPLLPAFAASSPYVEGKPGPLLDSRLHFYLQNQRRIPSIIGAAIPEPVDSEQAYQKQILQPMYRDIAAVDPEGLLQHEWLNSRAAIARFERQAIEIRILDIQESTKADFALIGCVVKALKNLVALGDPRRLSEVSQETLVAVLQGSLREQGDFVLPDGLYKEILGGQATVADNFRKLAEPAAEYPFFESTLAERIKSQLGDTPSQSEITNEYKVLAECLSENRFYEP